VKLRFLTEAEAESKAAANHYEEQQEGLGAEFLDAVALALRAIERDPFRFARIQKPRTKREIRQHNVKRFPYSVVYERIDTEFVVLAIAHAKRHPSYWLRRKTDDD